MPRYALLIEYDGSGFNGWQTQNGLVSVQGAIQGALAKLDRGFAAGARIAAAGRTDAGVHAYAQTAHADLEKEWDPVRLASALNAHLRPQPVVVRATSLVGEDFHARFSAMERRYIFRILNRRAPPALDRLRAWHVRHDLVVDQMRQATKYLIGKHDFTTFRSSMCQASSAMRSISEISITNTPLPDGQEIRVFLRARSFLHNQVRSIVGSLERVGAGSWTPERMGEALAAKDRAACGPVTPPHGLYLAGVTYPVPPFPDEV